MRNERGLVVLVIAAAAAIGTGVSIAIFEVYGWTRDVFREKPKEVVIELSEEQLRELPVVNGCDVWMDR